MTSTPRHFSRTCAALLLASAFALSPAFGQTRAGDARRSTPPAAKNSKQAARKQDDASLRQRQRQQAIDALREAADAARSFENQAASVQVQTFAADALWRFDEPTARIIFRRAWEAATKVDDANSGESQEDSPRPESLPSVSLRDEVLPVIAARDTRMAGVFLQELSDEEQRSGDEQSAGETLD